MRALWSRFGADLVPRAAVGCGEFGHDAGAVLVFALLGLFHQVGVDGVRAGGAVAGDEAGAAVGQVGADHFLRPLHEGAPDAHAGGLGFDVDADGLADGGVQAVGADQEVVAGGAAVGGAHGDGPAVVRYCGDGLAVADPGACLFGTFAEDGGEVGAVHAQGGGEVVAAGPDVFEDGDDGAVGSGARRPRVLNA